MVKTANIIGAGIGGIATAIRLQAKGYQVSVYESSNELGGKLRDFNLDGFRFDAGPSLFTLPDLVDELFRIAQKNPKDYFQYEQLDRSCHYFWDDGTALVAWSDRKAFKAEVKKQLGADELPLEKKLQHSAFQYNTLAGLFMHKSLHKWRSFANWATLRALLRIPFLGLSTSMHKANKKLNNDKLTTGLILTMLLPF
ncbi:MAG: NAD(P)-binding protein [Flavobacteriales bacterium]|nr:NAD(P)-binding protein [Flavobacteriales bacterium]